MSGTCTIAGGWLPHYGAVIYSPLWCVFFGSNTPREKPIRRGNVFVLRRVPSMYQAGSGSVVFGGWGWRWLVVVPVTYTFHVSYLRSTPTSFRQHTHFRIHSLDVFLRGVSQKASRI